LTLENPPASAISYQWKIDGGNGAVVFTNGQQMINNTTPYATVKYMRVNGGGYKANLSVKVIDPRNPGELDYGPLSYISCAAILDRSVPKPPSGGTVIDIYFKPQYGFTLTQAEKACGYFNFDWQQTITSMPLPSGVYSASDIHHLKELYAPPAFNDPPSDGYPPDPKSNNIVNADRIPVYWNLYQSGYPWGLDYYETDNSLEFYDSPANNCLQGGLVKIAVVARHLPEAIMASQPIWWEYREASNVLMFVTPGSDLAGRILTTSQAAASMSYSRFIQQVRAEPGVSKLLHTTIPLYRLRHQCCSTELRFRLPSRHSLQLAQWLP
jgi:hypothetical protein